MQALKTFRWLIWLSVALIGLSVFMIFMLPFLASLGLFVLEFKMSTNFWGKIWLGSFFGVPLGLLGVYIFGLFEWGFWRKNREELGYEKSFIPQYVLEYVSILIGMGILAGVFHAVMIEIGYEYRFWGEVIWGIWTRSIMDPGIIAIPLTIVILWALPHQDKWRLFATLVIAVNLIISFIYGSSEQFPRVYEFLTMTEQEYLEKYRPFEVMKEEVVEFEPPMSAERWERYVEALEWSVFDGELESVTIMIVDEEGDALAEVEVREDLEFVRDRYREAMRERGDDDWYEARIGSMRVVGTQFRPVFREIDREGGFDEVKVK